MNIGSLIKVGIVCVLLFSCATKDQYGMIEDPSTGLQYGSVVERNLFIDPAQLQNRRIKVSVRNTSGDPVYDLKDFEKSLEEHFIRKGYEQSGGDDFGFRFDVNVLYSGRVQKDLMMEFGFLGAAAGGIMGYRSNASAGTAIGILSGATLGSIIGSYMTEDTYIVVAEISIGVPQPRSGETETTIVFSSSKIEQRQEQTGIKRFSETMNSKIAVFAGGRNVTQQQIAGGVRERIISILSDII